MITAACLLTWFAAGILTIMILLSWRYKHHAYIEIDRQDLGTLIIAVILGYIGLFITILVLLSHKNKS